jgi:hypothetical protein
VEDNFHHHLLYQRQILAKYLPDIETATRSQAMLATSHKLRIKATAIAIMIYIKGNHTPSGKCLPPRSSEELKLNILQ